MHASTRPGGEVVSADEEMRRLAFALPIIRDAEPDAILSIDTFRASIAKRTIEEFGADIINDVEEGKDPNNVPFCRRIRCTLYINVYGSQSARHAHRLLT